MKKIIITFLLMLLANVAMAQKIEIVPTSTLKGPQGVVANAVVDDANDDVSTYMIMVHEDIR